MKVRKKPVVVEAIRIDENSNPRMVKQWCMPHDVEYDSFDRYIIPTLEGDMVAMFGDWIIKGVNGEIYPCKPDIFDKTYDILDENPTGPDPALKISSEWPV